MSEVAQSEFYEMNSSSIIYFDEKEFVKCISW